MPTLTEIVNAIPTASRGDIITPETHNSLRDAIIALAGQLGATSPSHTITRTFAPAFFPIGTDPGWQSRSGFVRNPSGNMVKGWMPVALPDGYQIKRFFVIAGRQGAVEAPQQIDVMLQRQSLRGSNTAAVTLASISLVGAANERDPFELSTNFAAAGLTGSDSLNAAIIDNDDYKYLVRAEVLLTTTTTAPSIFIYGLRIECGTGQAGGTQILQLL